MAIPFIGVPVNISGAPTAQAVTSSSTSAVALPSTGSKIAPKWLVMASKGTISHVRLGASGVGAATTSYTPVFQSTYVVTKLDDSAITHFRVIGDGSGTLYVWVV